MNINYVAKKTIIKDSFKERAAKKLAKLDRFFDETAKATIVVSNVKDRETVEVTVKLGGMIYRAERTTPDRADSLDLVIDLLIKQIIKNKTRLEKRLKASAFDVAYKDEPEETDNFEIVRTKEIPIKPMAVDEAILQMNLLEHTFFVFKDAKTNEVTIVYKRKDGKYGLIAPVDEI